MKLQKLVDCKGGLLPENNDIKNPYKDTRRTDIHLSRRKGGGATKNKGKSKTKGFRVLLWPT